MKTGKKIFIFCLILVLLSMAGVSAGEVDDISVQTGDEITQDSPQANFLAAGEDNDILSDNANDLQSLIDNALDNATLDLNQDYKISDGDVKISKNITINGNNHIISAGSNSRIKINGDGISVVLMNMTFKNGHSGDGGAIYNSHSSSPLILVDCQFISNYAENNGGAVYTKGNLYVYGCTFESNTVDDDDGGAICAIGKITVIKNSTFSKNKDKGSIIESSNGGAVYSKNSLTIDSCTFTDNMADDNGGAVYSDGDLDIRYSTFKSNKADDDNGGAVYCTGNLYIYHALFDSNKAYVDGGAIFCKGKTTALFSIFSNNKASGAISRCFGGAIRSKGTCNITGCDFEKNYAEDYGGAVYADGDLYIYGQRYWDSMEYNTWNCFTENKAVNYGGAAYVGGNFYTNLDKGSSQEKDYDRIIGLRTVEFEYNSVSEDDGGAVYCCGNSYVNDAFFLECSSKVDGGALYCEGKTTITNSGFERNKASGATQRCFGGAVRSEGACYIDSSMFSENYAEDYGGAVYADDDIRISNDCLFNNNVAENYGGAVYAEDNVYINWNLENTKTPRFLVNSVKTDDGGAIYAEDNVYINNAYFERCFAKIDGGAVYCKGKSTLTHSRFLDNTVLITNSIHLNYGGAICSKGTCTVDYCSFSGNFAYDRGGAIYGYKEVKINNSEFECNYADNYGGAVYADTIKTISNSLFRYNTADTDDGGAVYINSKCTTTITGCKFINNEAKDEGGAIYTDSAYGKINLYSNIFIGNKAGDKGHAIYNSGEFGTVNGNWYGSNNPSFKSLLKIFHWVGSDSDYKDSHYAQIHIKINDTELYKGETYKVTVYFKTKDGKDLTKEMNRYGVSFYGDGKFSNQKVGHNEVTVDVVFNKENPVIKAKMDNQVLELSLTVKNKTQSQTDGDSPTDYITPTPEAFSGIDLDIIFDDVYLPNDLTGKIITDVPGLYNIVVDEEDFGILNVTESPYEFNLGRFPAGNYTVSVFSRNPDYEPTAVLAQAEVKPGEFNVPPKSTVNIKNIVETALAEFKKWKPVIDFYWNAFSDSGSDRATSDAASVDIREIVKSQLLFSGMQLLGHARNWILGLSH